MATATLIQAPDRSLAQRLEALERANEIRSRRAEMKRDLKAGREPILPLLIDPPDWLLTMKVIELLLAMPKVGRVKADKVLKRHEISPSRTVGGISPRQRNELISALAGRR